MGAGREDVGRQGAVRRRGPPLRDRAEPNDARARLFHLTGNPGPVRVAASTARPRTTLVRPHAANHTAGPDGQPPSVDRCRRRARHHGVLVRRAMDHRRGAEGDRGGGGRRTLGPGPCQRSRVVRFRPRRHRDGSGGRADRRALDRDVRRPDDRCRPFALHARTGLAALCRPRPVHRADRPRRHQRAALCRHEPAVQASARLGLGADLKRHLRGRRRVAAAV